MSKVHKAKPQVKTTKSQNSDENRDPNERNAQVYNMAYEWLLLQGVRAVLKKYPLLKSAFRCELS